MFKFGNIFPNTSILSDKAPKLCACKSGAISGRRLDGGDIVKLAVILSDNQIIVIRALSIIVIKRSHCNQSYSCICNHSSPCTLICSWMVIGESSKLDFQSPKQSCHHRCHRHCCHHYRHCCHHKHCHHCHHRHHRQHCNHHRHHHCHRCHKHCHSTSHQFPTNHHSLPCQL